jgi:hypothetical protein
VRAVQRHQLRDDQDAAINWSLAQLAGERRAAQATIDTEVARRGALLSTGTVAEVGSLDETGRPVGLQIEGVA